MLRDLKESGIKLLGDFGINAYNSETWKALQSLGIEKGIDSLEEDGIHFGSYPLMTFEYDTDVAEIVDRKNVSYRMIKAGYSNQTILVRNTDEKEPMKVISNLPQRPSRIRFYIV